MILSPSDFLKPRFEFIKDYPDAPFLVGAILDAYEHEGRLFLIEAGNLEPTLFPFNFRKLRWHDHRTLEQLLSIKYMKIISGSDYYGVGDIVEVLHFMYNNATYVGGRDSILFNLKGHFFNITQLQPATKDEHDEFWEFMKKIK